MVRKFVIFIDEDYNPTIVLDNVDLHRYIPAPKNTIARAGGGLWNINNGTLQLSDESIDFGKYNKELAKEAFKAKLALNS